MLSTWTSHDSVQKPDLAIDYPAATAVVATVGETEVKWPVVVLYKAVICVSTVWEKSIGGTNGK
jgi:hypothetical protein